jgi:hypothetical protein
MILQLQLQAASPIYQRINNTKSIQATLQKHRSILTIKSAAPKMVSPHPLHLQIPNHHSQTSTKPPSPTLPSFINQDSDWEMVDIGMDEAPMKEAGKLLQGAVNNMAKAFHQPSAAGMSIATAKVLDDGRGTFGVGLFNLAVMATAPNAGAGGEQDGYGSGSGYLDEDKDGGEERRTRKKREAYKPCKVWEVGEERK